MTRFSKLELDVTDTATTSDKAGRGWKDQAT
jgi:hypothetical protein